MHLLIFSVFFRNSFVTYFILTRNVMYVIRTLQIRIKITWNLRFYSVVTGLSQFYIMYFNQVHALTIRYNDLNLGVLFHYCTNFTFLCVVKNEQETDSLGLSGQNQDDKLHR